MHIALTIIGGILIVIGIQLYLTKNASVRRRFIGFMVMICGAPFIGVALAYFLAV